MFDASLNHWQERLSTSVDSLNLPTDYSRIDSVLAVEQVSLPVLSEALKQELRHFVESTGVPLPIVHLSVFYTMLFRYSGVKKLCVGVPKNLETDDAKQLDNLQNIIPIAVQLDPTSLFSEFALEVYQLFQEDSERSETLSLEQIARVGGKLEIQNAGLFRAVFSFVTNQDPPFFVAQSVFQSDIPELSDVEWHLELNGDASDETGLLYFRSDLFEQSTVERFSEHYVGLLSAVVEQPDTCIGELNYLSESGRQHLIEGMNQTLQDYTKHKTVSQLFSEQALISNCGLAVQGPDDRTLSYKQLEQDSNRLARYLVSCGVGSGVRVGVYLERSVEMLVTLLAVMKSGAAYVPLDPMFPADRLAYMAEDAELVLIVTQSKLVELVPIKGCEQVVLDTLVKELGTQSIESIDCSEPDAAAYVLYTSGSTGKPKGVQVSHKALNNFMSSMGRSPGLFPDDKLLAVTTLSFDIAALELYLPLLVGAEVVLASREEASDPQQLSARLLTCDISVMQATPATWRMLIESGWNGGEKLRVWCGGEAMSRDLAENLLDRSKDVWNLYGPTETTIWSTIWRVVRGSGIVPVGVPIANTQVYVLDESMQLVPPGVVGELFIGGDGVADGYLNRSSLTAERFVNDKFSGIVGARLYKTGDRARWRADGQLEVQGRLDDQVKLRGYRIEPGEIRSALVEVDSVRDAVVMVRDDEARDTQLVAYVISDPKYDLNIEELRQFLLGRMPEYMVPSGWIEMNEFPLTPNGKVDKNRLPAPVLAEIESDIASLSESELKIATVWQEVLGVNSVGIDQSFFELGGNSLLAIRLVAKLKAKCGITVPIISLFHGDTIAEIAKKIPGNNSAQPVSIAVTDESAGDHQANASEILTDSINNSAGPSADFEIDELNVCRLISKSADGIPFFILGSNPRYALVTAKLHPQFSVYQLDAYALQLIRRSSKKSIPNTVQKIAAAYMSEVRAVQPKGPYRIGGGCEGASIALELALQLENEGEQVEKLLTWHTPAPGPEIKKDFGGSTLRRFWWQLQSVFAGGSSAGIGLRGYLNLIHHEIIEFSLLSAMFKYRPAREFSGDIDIVVLEDNIGRGDDNDEALYQNYLDGWRVLVKGELSVFQLKGTHDSWLKEDEGAFGDFLISKLSS